MNDPKCIKHTMRKARKRYQCVECSLPIKPGDRYRDTTGVWEFGAGRFRMCSSCSRWADGALYTFKLERYPIGELADVISELTLKQGTRDVYEVRRQRL